MSENEETTPVSPLVQLMIDTDGNEEKIGQTVIAVLELLTMRAANDCAYAIRSDDGRALFVIAVEEDAKMLEEILPEHFKDYADPPNEDEPEQLELDFDTNTDPGDEQDEPTSESV
jgi:hypothetical protein